MSDTVQRLALTPGEPAGIGPDLAITVAQRDWPFELVAIADPDVLSGRARQLGLPLTLTDYDPQTPPAPARAGELKVCSQPLPALAAPGKPDPANARSLLRALDRACEGCRSGEFDALVTGPLHKSVINDAGIPFAGHTGYLEQQTGAAQSVMLLVAGELRVALVTTHLALRDVPAAITRERVRSVTGELQAGLIERFGIERPRILVLGLNPHAGEGGHLGREEIEVIEPVLDELRAGGLLLEGPLPADTAFTPPCLERADAVLAMYHDQGLTVLKHRGFGRAVNVTLGLPIVRTSVDHGTALELAGSGRAEPGSLIAALELAAHMAARGER